MLGEGKKPPIRIWKLEDAPREFTGARYLAKVRADGRGQLPEELWIVLIPAHYANGPEMVDEIFDFVDEWKFPLPDGSRLLVGGM